MPWRQFLDAVKRGGEETEYRQDRIKEFSLFDIVGIIGTTLSLLLCLSTMPFLCKSFGKNHDFFYGVRGIRYIAVLPNRVRSRSEIW